MADQTPAERQAEKAKAAHDNQVKAEKDFSASLPKNSDAAQGQVAAPAQTKEGTSYPKEGRTNDVGTVEYYQPGTAGDNADPERVFESRDPATRATNLVSDEDTKAAEKAANDSRVKVNDQGENPKAKQDAAKEAKSGGSSNKQSGSETGKSNPDKGDLPAQSGSNKQTVNNSDAGVKKD
jgi:hypothetical protein